MAEPKAYDMSEYWRLVSVDGGRVTGTFWVSLADGHDPTVKSVDATVWADDRHSWGRTLYSNSLTAFVKDDEVEIPEHMIRDQVRADVLDAMDDMVRAVRLCVEAAKSAAGERSED